MSDPAIRCRNLTKRYAVERLSAAGLKNLVLHLPSRLTEVRESRGFLALDGIDLEVAKGECVGIVGRNGAGKSTTLGLISGVLEPTSGTIETNGRVVPLLELGAGFHHELTGRENVLLNAVLLGLSRREAERRLDSIIEFAELGEFIDRPLRMYSTGMEARLGFAVAVHCDPDVLLVDEVLSVGDEAFGKKCLKRIEAFHEAGVTMVLVGHALDAIRQVCTRIVCLDAGKVVSDGPPDEVLESYRELAGAGA